MPRRKRQTSQKIHDWLDALKHGAAIRRGFQIFERERVKRKKELTH